MSKELKTGDKITCFIEQKLPNCLVVRFQNGKAGSGNSTSIFRGVLIDENSPVTKRDISSSPINSKPKLTKEFTTTFIQNYNSKNVSGKALRNKKPSCIVLDDFCIDYHNTSFDVKPEKKKQYLKPKGTVVQVNDEVEFTEKGEADRQYERSSPSGVIENDTDLAKDGEERSSTLDKTETPVILSRTKASDAVFQEESCLPKEMTNDQGENRYSKRSRSGKPKRFFGSEFDMHPGFDKKSPNKAPVEEIKKKEPSLLSKQKLKEEMKSKIRKSKVNEKKETKNGSSPSTHEIVSSLKRSARIQLKRSKQSDSKSDATFDAEHSEIERNRNKRKKLDTNRNEVISKLSSHSSTTVQCKDGDENKSKDSPRYYVKDTHKKSNLQNEGLKNQSYEENKKSIALQRSIVNKIKKEPQSPRRPYEKIVHQRPSTRCLTKQKTAARNEISQKRNNFEASNERNNGKVIESDIGSLLCHEPALNDDFDCVRNLRKRLAVLMQAERILGGRIKLLHPEDISEFEKRSMDKKFIQDRPSTAMRQEAQLCQIKSKSKSRDKDMPATSKIIIDRSKGIVSIQPTTLNDSNGNEQGEQISEDILPDDGNHRDRINESRSVFIVINRRAQGMVQNRADTKSSEPENCGTENEKNNEKICSSEDDKLNYVAAPKEGDSTHAKSSERIQTPVLIEDDTESCLKKENENIGSIYAELSFNRLLASVHEEAAKTNLISEDVSSREKVCAISNTNDAKADGASMPDKNQDSNGGTCSNVESSIQLENTDARKLNKAPKEGDLVLQEGDLMLQRSFEIKEKDPSTAQKIEEINVKISTEDMLVSGGNSDGGNGHALIGNAAKDNQVCRQKNVKGKISSKQFKVGQALLDALRALKGDSNDSSEESSPQSMTKLPNMVPRQNDISSCPITLSSTCNNRKESRTDLILSRHPNMSLFKAKTTRQQRPSIELISGLRNIEQRMIDLSRGRQIHSATYSVIGNIDSVQDSNFAKPHNSPRNQLSRDDDDIPDAELEVKCERDSSTGEQNVTCNDSCILKEKLREEECRVTQDNQDSSLLEGVRDQVPRNSKQRRKNLKPIKNSSILRAHPEKSLILPVLNKTVKAKILQFDGKKSTTRSKCKAGSFIVEKECDGKTCNTSDNGAKRLFSDGETLKTVYSLGKVRKSYKHTKTGARKYPIPSRSSIRRNPRYCWKVLGKAYPGKGDAEGPSYDLLSMKKPNAAREQGEELLKEILKLNQGILIRQDFNN